MSEEPAVQQATRVSDPSCNWVRVGVIADSLDITRRAVRASLGKGAWGDPGLITRKVPVQGGRGGVLEIALDALPEEIQAAVRERLHTKRPNAADAEAEQSDLSRLLKLTERARRRIEKRIQACAGVARLLAAGVPKMQAYEAVRKQFGQKGTRTIPRWWSSVEHLPREKWAAKLADERRGGAHLSPCDPALFADARRAYMRPTRPSIAAVHLWFNKKAKERGLPFLSYKALVRRLAREPHFMTVREREGDKEFERRCLLSQERDYSDVGVLDIAVADGRKLDVWARGEDGKLRRYILLAWMDVRTRFIIGWDIGETESAGLYLSSFATAVENTGGIPRFVYLDNGTGASNQFMTGGDEKSPFGVFPMLGIEVIRALPYRPGSKPIESFFRTIAEFVDKTFPEDYAGNRPGGGVRDIDPEKAPTLKELRLAVRQALELYHDRPHRGDSMGNRSPREVYEELIAQTPVKVAPPGVRRLCLLEAKHVRIRRDDGCIFLFGNRYHADSLNRLPRNVAYVARYNPRSLEEPLALFDEAGRFIADVPLVTKTGFRDRAAAAKYARDNRARRRAMKEEADSRLGMRSATRWLSQEADGATPDGAPDGAQVIPLPKPKIVEPVRTSLELPPSRGKNTSVVAGEPEMSVTDLLRAHTQRAQEAARDREGVITPERLLTAVLGAASKKGG